jgi:DNA adenine methylase
MQYMGGKCRIAKDIASVILQRESHRSVFIDAFVGGAAVSAALAPHFAFTLANDAHPDLISMYRALQAGWTPPEHVSEQEYASLKQAPISALRGFVGFGCSFGGKWFGGYARTSRVRGVTRNYAAEACSSLLRDIEKMRTVEFTHGSYLQLQPPPGAIVYCDPPYTDTTRYSVGEFNSVQFWDTCREWRASGVRVYVSEYCAPTDWTPVWRKTRRQGLRSAISADDVKLERLYV